MNLTILFPSVTHPAIEERYGASQTRLLLSRQAPSASVIEYTPSAPVAEALGAVTTDRTLIVTDPFLVPPPRLVASLSRALDESPSAAAAVPVTNESTEGAQLAALAEPVLTLGSFERVTEELDAAAPTAAIVTWTSADPGVLLARTEAIRRSGSAWPSLLEGLEVVIASSVYVFRYAPQRRFLRGDLLEKIPSFATAILEFGCGEAALGEALKARQPCRVVGIELDAEAASVAEGRIDAVHQQDVREVIRTIDETFDWIVGGDILEHLDDPWQFLRELGRIVRPGGQLLLSIPNVACWPIAADLLRGRFDYTFAGHLCAGHLRFFTRRTIGDLLAMSGWELVEIEARDVFDPEGLERFVARMAAAGIPCSIDDLGPMHFLVVARVGA